MVTFYNLHNDHTNTVCVKIHLKMELSPKMNAPPKKIQEILFIFQM